MKRKFRYTLLIITIALLLFSTGCKKKEVPALTTTAITNITGTSATSGGTITDEGSGTIISRGVCWSKAITPTIDDVRTTDGAGASTFISNMIGLNGATTYYVRAYATNSSGTGYGMAMSFTTYGQAPSAATQSATNVTSTSATLNGVINANYLSTVVTFEYGLTNSYGLSATATQSPVSDNSATTVSINITGIMPGSIYHFRVKSVNELGTTYGSDLTFTTLGQKPLATTQAAVNILTSTATLKGTVNANYLSTIVTFEYGPTLSYGSTVTSVQSPVTGNLNTTVNATISGLIPGTLYHFRIKAANSLGETTGNDLSFTTLGQIPTVTTQAATAVQITTAILNCIVNANYLSTVVTFEYGISTSYGSTVFALQSPIAGASNLSASITLIDLLPGTTYHYRVKGTNSIGTTYGNDMTFVTYNSDAIKDYMNNYYNIVTIGSQVWMAENLKTTKYNDGTTIPLVSNGTTWINLSTPAYCWYNNDATTYKATYGALYNWYTVKTGKLCPTGWHVPTDAEWTTLINYLGGGSVAGDKLRESGTTHWISSNTGATNETGFTALPGGYRDYDGSFVYIGYYGRWWSSTEVSAYDAWCRGINYDSNNGAVRNNKTFGFSVRCLRY